MITPYWCCSSFVENILLKGNSLFRCATVKSFLFHPVVFSTSLATKAPDIIERLVAIPASALRFEIPHAGMDDLLQGRSLPAWVSTFVNMVCITHDSAALKKYQAAVRGRKRQKYRPNSSLKEEYGKKSEDAVACVKEGPLPKRQRAKLNPEERKPNLLGIRHWIKSRRCCCQYTDQRGICSPFPRIALRIEKTSCFRSELFTFAPHQTMPIQTRTEKSDSQRREVMCQQYSIQN